MSRLPAPITPRRLAAAALLALAGACGGTAPVLPGEELAAADVLSVGARLETALLTSAHAGLRRVQSEYVADSGRHRLVYDERIVTDGHGNYALDPVRVLEGAETDFLLYQKARTGLAFLYRDFRVRDLGLFQQNYVVLDAGAETFVAGRVCSELVVHRPGRDRVYTVAMDEATGIVLRYAETDLAGRTIASMEYLTFEEDPDVSGVAFHRPRVEQDSLPLERLLFEADTLLGFDPLVPTWLPAGYELADASVVADPLGEGKWARLTYTDGVDSLFFLHGGAVAAGPEEAAVPSAEGATAAGSDVQVYEIAPLTVLQGSLRHQRVIAMGKLEGDSLLRLVGSAR